MPSGTRRFVVVLAPGTSRACEKSEWRGVLLVVEQGGIEVETATDSRHFGCGAVLFLDGLRALALHNPGPGEAVLAGVGRTDSFSAGAPSHE